MFGNMLDRLRPKNDTAEELAAALAEVERALEEQKGREAALQADLGEALLMGGERARQHEAALRATRDEVERLTAMAQALRARHAEAERRERRERLERMAAEAREKAERAGRAIGKNYLRLAKEFIKLLEDELDALLAIAKVEQEVFAAGEEGTGILPIDPPQKFYSQSNGFIPAMPLCRVMTLPRHDASLPQYGSPPLWRGDVDVVTASARGA